MQHLWTLNGEECKDKSLIILKICIQIGSLDRRTFSFKIQKFWTLHPGLQKIEEEYSVAYNSEERLS